MIKQASMSGSVRADGMSRGWAVGSRLALLFTALLIVLMPFTEYFWHFDQFLQGGQDLELGLLAIATIFCLVMVMVQHGNRSVRLSLALRNWLVTVFRQHADMTSGSSTGLVGTLHLHPVPSPSLRLYRLPLQI